MAYKIKVVVNAGHGVKNVGSDPGAIGATGYQEATQNKEVAVKLVAELRNRGYEVLFIQDGDLKDVVSQSNRWGANYFIALHTNASENRSANGMETYAVSPGGMGEKIARAVQSALVKATKLVDRGVKFAGFYVLKYTNCPAILIEAGFISNLKEETLMKQDSFDELVATAIADGFERVVPPLPSEGKPPEVLKIPYLVLANKGADERAAAYLADLLECGVPQDKETFDARRLTQYAKVYEVGGAQRFSGTTLLAGADRYDTCRKVLDEIARLRG